MRNILLLSLEILEKELIKESNSININLALKIIQNYKISNLINVDKERSIDVIITRLRKKIENDPKNPKYLQTVRGEGYVLWIE